MRRFPVPALKKFHAADGTVIDIGAILEHTYDDIGEAGSIIPPHIGWFGYMKALAVERKINGKQRVKQAEAKAYFALRNGEFVSRGFGDKFTEKALEHAVELDPEVIKMTQDYAAAERDVERHDWVIDALRAKLDLARSTETTRRMEHEPDRGRSTT